MRLERGYARISRTPKNNTAQARGQPALWANSVIGSATTPVFSAISLFQQFAMRRLHLLAAEIVDAQSLHDAVLAVLAGHRVGIDHPRRNSIAAVGGDRHADPITRRRAQHPIVNVVERRRGGGSRGGGAARLDDRRAALLHR